MPQSSTARILGLVAGAIMGAFDCGEPPCIARLKVRNRAWLWNLVRDCAAWTSRYKRVPDRHSFIVPCGPDGEEQIVFLSPHWTDFPGDADQMTKRLHSRWKLAQESWSCDP